MAYATRSDLTTFSLPPGALTGIASDRLDAALEAASRLADGYLNARYRLPLKAYGSDLKKAVCDIAALMIIKGRGFNPEQADADLLVSANKEALSWLQGIAAGKISPYGLRDSGPTEANATDTDETSHGAFVVQLQEEAPEKDGFWSGTTSGDGSGVGTPKRRGW